MKAFLTCCVIGLVLSLGVIAYGQLDNQRRIRYLESRTQHHYELILHLYGQDKLSTE